MLFLAEVQALFGRLQEVPLPARKLFCVIVRNAYHGPMHPKPPGTAVPAEILEACGLDVGDFYSLIETLKAAGLVEVSGDYPMERISLPAAAAVAETIAERCAAQDLPLEEALVELDGRSLR